MNNDFSQRKSQRQKTAICRYSPSQNSPKKLKKEDDLSQDSLRFLFAKFVLVELKSKKFAPYNEPFLQPVDPVKLNIPKYFQIIKKPMDFKTILEKLEKNEYKNISEIHADANLVFENCFTFNAPNSRVFQMGLKLQEKFNCLWSAMPLKTTFSKTQKIEISEKLAFLTPMQLEKVYEKVSPFVHAQVGFDEIVFDFDSLPGKIQVDLVSFIEFEFEKIQEYRSSLVSKYV